jgi:diguanylate cyclase (GGDEF)-like protein
VLLDQALDSGQPVTPDEFDAMDAVQMAGFRSAVAVYLGEQRNAVWRLWFESREVDRHDYEALDLLTSAVRQAYRTVAEIERLRSWSEELERRANIDQLTGVLNRRGLGRAIEEGTLSAGGNIAALYLDLNQFKPINDEYGHDSGDHVLRIVARRFASCLPAGGLLARVGGDEFAIVVDVSRIGEGSNASAELDELRKRLEASLADPIAHQQQELKVSVSVGIGRGDPGTALDELLRRADIEMYERKRAQADVSENPGPSDVVLP